MLPGRIQKTAGTPRYEVTNQRGVVVQIWIGNAWETPRTFASVSGTVSAGGNKVRDSRARDAVSWKMKGHDHVHECVGRKGRREWAERNCSAEPTS